MRTSRNPAIAAAQERAAQVARDFARETRVNVVRKVYLLPADLALRIIQYQIERRLPSEVAAAKELLEQGLAMAEHVAAARAEAHAATQQDPA